MPELPEVETTLRGISSWIVGKKIKQVIVRHSQLRFPIPQGLHRLLKGRTIGRITRRGKYLLLPVETGTLIMHLGMSGRIKILSTFLPSEKHDHFDIIFENGVVCRYRDPRRFGALLFTKKDPLDHPLLKNLGPEPLSRAFHGRMLWQIAQKKNIPVKAFIMDSKVVVGVGNIYATEALFEAKINPLTPAKAISLVMYQRLAKAIKAILRLAIKAGGTTLRDFAQSDGSKGYFYLRLKAYGRQNQPCVQCNRQLVSTRIAMRSTVYCTFCQA